MTEDQRVTARQYYRDPPQFAVLCDEPWWWAVFMLGADLINIGFDPGDFRGPLAVVARGQRPMDYTRDVDALDSLLSANGGSSLNVWRCPRNVTGRVVGLVEVEGTMDDASAAGIWFSGPYALKVTNKVLMAQQNRPDTNCLDRDRFCPLNYGNRQSIQYALTVMASGMQHW